MLSKIRRLTPARITRRLKALAYPRILANSIPKAGTFLMIRLFKLLTFEQRGHFDIGPDQGVTTLTPRDVTEFQTRVRQLRPRDFYSSHAYYFPEFARLLQRNSTKIVTIIRDPRDVCVSDAFFIAKNKLHRLHPYYRQMSAHDQLMASIVGMTSDQLGGDAPSLDIGAHYRGFEGWLSYRDGFIVRFEDIVGASGGGTADSQLTIVKNLVNYLGVRVSSSRLQEICQDIFWTGSPTFRKGQIGNWKEHFEPDHTEAFLKVMGPTLSAFGYE